MLPFASLSEDKSNAYFADGIQDEILTRLAKIAELKVISRTSTQRFKSTPGDLRQIAQQLDFRVVERAGRPGVQGQHADRLAVDVGRVGRDEVAEAR